MSTCLVILDGFGIGENTPDNAIFAAHHPVFEELFQSPYARLWTHGRRVGIPDDQTGGSEVGHLTIGAGRVCPQTLVRVDDLFADGLAEHPEYQGMLEYAYTHNRRIHIVMIFSDGGIHAKVSHLKELLKILPEDITVQLHIGADGRDVGPTTLPEILHRFDHEIDSGKLQISTLFGRYFWFDRDNNWDRVEPVYRVMTREDRTNCPKSSEIFGLIQKRYSEGVMDEYHEPIAFSDGASVTDGDVLWCLNFRADRGREMSQMFSDDDFTGFDRGAKKDIFYLATFKYYPTFTGHFLLGEVSIENTLPEVIASAGKTQLHMSETDKFIHVTKFFAWLRSEPFEGQTNQLFPSYKGGPFSEKPQMDASVMCDFLLENLEKYDFTVVNFPNGDLVGHCGSLKASIKAVQALGDVVGRIIEYSRSHPQDTFIVTADHGNCERMGTPENPDTAHTKNPVPCWIIQSWECLTPTIPESDLTALAPTVLHCMDIEKPLKMIGESII